MENVNKISPTTEAVESIREYARGLIDDIRGGLNRNSWYGEPAFRRIEPPTPKYSKTEMPGFELTYLQDMLD